MSTLALIVLLTSLSPFLFLGIFALVSLKVEAEIERGIGR